MPTTSSNASNLTASPMFRMQNLGAKGRGLVAATFIPKGTRILQETPLLTLRSSTMMFAPSAEVTLHGSLQRLSPADQQKFLQLHNAHLFRKGEFPFTSMFKTNAFPGRSLGGSAVFATISLINHSCPPNTEQNWNDKQQCKTIHALRNISEGEEIIISYCANLLSVDRQLHCSKNFGFSCRCELCSRPASELAASDKRRLEIDRLDKSIASPNRIKLNPKEVLADCHSLLLKIREEYGESVGSLEARLYYDAFQVAAGHSDTSRAAVFGRRAYDMTCMTQGEDHPSAQEQKRLAEDPQRFPGYGFFGKSRIDKSPQPKKKDKQAFEKWLWLD